MSRRTRWLSILTIALALGLVTAAIAQSVQKVAPGNGPFQRTWARTDKPVADGVVSRTWMWGPEANSVLLYELYDESPGRQRVVQYYDKSRMEITNPDAFDDGVWYVTNGLLVNELVSGRMQIGNSQFIQGVPANVNLAGDPGQRPTYADINQYALQGQQALPVGSVIIQRFDDGVISKDDTLAQYNVTAAERVTVTGIDHTIASPFWTFMTSQGTVYENGQFVQANLFVNPYYATGYPITEAWWSRIAVGGQERDLLWQCFERRCLTYTPDNPGGWQVEAGNVGQHYYAWRYPGGDVTPAPTATPTATVVAPTNTPVPPTNTPVPPTATPTEEPQPNCHASYPTVCIPPPPPDLDCGDISYRNFTVLPPDPHRLDGNDNDGIGCES